MEKIKLGKILKIKTGLRQIRYKKDEKGKYEYKIIKFKHETTKLINMEELEIKKTNKEINPKYFLKENDIIMKLTPGFDAKRITFNEKNITVPTNYAIIHTNNKINPIILEYILNSKNIKTQLQRSTNPTKFNSINISNIKDLEIPIFNSSEEEILENIIKTFYKRKELFKKEISYREMEIDNLIFLAGE